MKDMKFQLCHIVQDIKVIELLHVIQREVCLLLPTSAGDHKGVSCPNYVLMLVINKVMPSSTMTTRNSKHIC